MMLQGLGLELFFGRVTIPCTAYGSGKGMPADGEPGA